MIAGSEAYNLTSDVKEAFQNLRLRRKHRWVIFGVDEGRNFFVDSTESSRGKDVKDLLKVLPEAECRYVIFDHEFETADHRKTDKLYFIMWSPRPTSTVSKMNYLHARPFIRGMCEGCYDLNASTANDVLEEVLQKDDNSDVDEAQVGDDDWVDS